MFVTSFASRLHHHTTTDGVEGVGHETSDRSHRLSNHPADNNVCVLGVWKHACKRNVDREGYLKAQSPGYIELLNAWKWKLTLCCVVDAKVSSSVDDDALYWNAEALVQTSDAIGLGDLHQTVSQAFELAPRSSFADISGQTCSGKVEGVDETERSGSGGATRRQVTSKVSPELFVLVHAVEENLLVLVLEGKVEGLSREVSDDIGQVPSPEREEALLFGDTDNAVDDALVLLVNCNLFAGMLYL